MSEDEQSPSLFIKITAASDNEQSQSLYMNPTEVSDDKYSAKWHSVYIRDITYVLGLYLYQANRSIC